MGIEIPYDRKKTLDQLRIGINTQIMPKMSIGRLSEGIPLGRGLT